MQPPLFLMYCANIADDFRRARRHAADTPPRLRAALSPCAIAVTCAVQRALIRYYRYYDARYIRGTMICFITMPRGA